MQKIRKILNRNKQLKIGKEKALKSKNIKDINDYIALLLHYVDNKEITLKDSHYKRCIEIIALSNEKMVFHFLNSLEFSSKQDSPERKEMILSLISMIKEYNPSIINLDMIEFLFFENKYLNFYKYEIRNNIGKDEIAKIILKTEDLEKMYQYSLLFDDCDVSLFEDFIIECNNLEYIYKFSHDIKGVNISKLEDAIIETKAVQEISYFACFIKGANVEKLCSALFEFKGYRYVLDVLLSVKVDKNIVEQYIKKLIFVGEIIYVEDLLDYYIEKYKNSNNEKLSTAKKSDMRINQLIEMNLLDKTDIDDYLVKVSTNKQRSFKDNILGLDNHIKKSLLESKNKNSSLNETDLIYDDWIYDGLNSFPNTKDFRLKLINLSLIYYNVLPSVVKDFKEVRENVELYLELLKKCDEKKYYYYKNAFEGKISFEQADTYYKYYLDQLLDSHVYLWSDMSHILKLKYSKK